MTVHQQAKEYNMALDKEIRCESFIQRYAILCIQTHQYKYCTHKASENHTNSESFCLSGQLFSNIPTDEHGF